MNLPESQNARDARVERLWRSLDTEKKGELDLKDLQKGLKKIDHPLKNASGLLQDVMKAVDTSGDGKIQYEEFRLFVENTETQLSLLFEAIDRDHNGNLDKAELGAAFGKAGLSVPPEKFNQFFNQIDINHDGVISFEEWRDFLVFIPSEEPGLKAVLSYYTTSISFSPEGDAVVSDGRKGLGTIPNFLKLFFGSILAIVDPAHTNSSLDHNRTSVDPQRAPVPKTQLVTVSGRGVAAVGIQSGTSASSPAMYAASSSPQFQPDIQEGAMVDSEGNDSLTSHHPNVGYFFAGACAGFASRTVTAPLDRLKTFLIANTGDAKAESLRAAKNGNPIVAAKHFGAPLKNALRDIWGAGGWKSLYAGNGLNVLKVMPESAMKYGFYDRIKAGFAHLEGVEDKEHISHVSSFISGGLSGALAQFTVYPLDTLKFRMQCNTAANSLHGNALIIDTARSLWASGGLRAVYRGVGLGVSGMFPYAAIDMGLFNLGKEYIILYKSKRNELDLHDKECGLSQPEAAVLGACGGTVGALSTYPINMLRTRLQAQGTLQHPQSYRGVVDCFQKTVSREGYRALYNGLVPNLCKMVPSTAVNWMVYTWVIQNLELE